MYLVCLAFQPQPVQSYSEYTRVRRLGGSYLKLFPIASGDSGSEWKFVRGRSLLATNTSTEKFRPLAPRDDRLNPFDSFNHYRAGYDIKICSVYRNLWVRNCCRLAGARAGRPSCALLPMSLPTVIQGFEAATHNSLPLCALDNNFPPFCGYCWQQRGAVHSVQEFHLAGIQCGGRDCRRSSKCNECGLHRLRHT